jgi:formate dehydrogenase iron-sulfur subunit
VRKTCPTGAMSFGELNGILAKAGDRLYSVKREFPEASLLDEESVRVVCLITHKRGLYHDNAMLEKSLHTSPA